MIPGGYRPETRVPRRGGAFPKLTEPAPRRNQPPR
jgi:hypothetical protein